MLHIPVFPGAEGGVAAPTECRSQDLGLRYSPDCKAKVWRFLPLCIVSVHALVLELADVSHILALAEGRLWPAVSTSTGKASESDSEVRQPACCELIDGPAALSTRCMITRMRETDSSHVMRGSGGSLEIDTRRNGSFSPGFDKPFQLEVNCPAAGAWSAATHLKDQGSIF